MRLNPFSRPGRGEYTDDDDEEEEVAIERVKRQSKRASTPSRRTKPSLLDSPESEDEEDCRYSSRERNLTYAGGSAMARGHARRPTRSRSRSGRGGGDRSMTPESRKHFSSPEGDIVRQNSNMNRSRRSRDQDASRKPRSASRNLSSSPEQQGRSRRASTASRGSSSRRSKPSRAYSVDSSESEGEEERVMARPSQPRRRSSSRRGQSPEAVRDRGRNRYQSEEEEEEEEEDGRSHSRGKVVPLSSRRRSRSQGGSSDSDPEEEEEEEIMSRPSSRRSGSHRGPSSVGRSRRASSPPSRKSKKSSSKSTKQARNSWGSFKMSVSPFVRRSKRDAREDEYEEDAVDVESDTDDYEESPPRRKGGRHDRSDVREQPAPQLHPPSPPIAKVEEDQYVPPKREAFADLYKYDNFPAIDRVPTAIGYRSDDSREEFDDRGGDDNASATSRYTVDVKSVRGSKLKKNKRGSNAHLNNRYMDPDGDDNFSHDETDDKYAQYLAGVNANAVMSDSSESCPPTWHPALDLDESDWYDEDETVTKKMNKEQSKSKKYQVSGSKPKSKRKKKIPVTSDTPKSAKEDKLSGRKKKEEEREEELEELEEANDDAIVANRSEVSDVIPGSSRHPGVRHVPALGDVVEEEDSDEDEATEERPRRRKKRGGKHRRKGYSMDEDEDEDSLEEEATEDSMDETAQRKQGRKGRKTKSAIMNTKATRGRKHSTKALTKGMNNKARSLKNKFKSFRRGGRAQLADYSSDDSSDSEGVHLAPTQTMYSEDPSSRLGQIDPTLEKLEMDEFKESTATHNMIRNNRKELLELDEMDEASIKADPNAFSCGVFPFAMGLGGGTSDCFFGSAGPAPANDIPLDSIQMQRLKDAKHDLETKPKVEVILQDLQDPMAEKYDKVEQMQRKKQREAQREIQVQREILQQERAELMRKKKEMREIEQKKIQMAQNRDQLALQEAPDLNRGKSQSFVMDISDWVLNLDNTDPNPTPKKKPASKREIQTPRTNGRDGNSSPIEKLPFSTIEVPTTVTSIDNADTHLQPPAQTQQGWRRKKKKNSSRQDSSPPGALHQEDGTAVPKRRNGSGKKKAPMKKKGWFRR